MGRPKIADESKMVSVRLDAETIQRLEKLQPKLAKPVELTLSQVVRAALDAGLATLERRR